MRNSIRPGSPILNSFWVALAMGLVLALPTILEACPTCKEGLANGANHPNLVRGYGWSILFMMSLPFMILAGLGTYFYVLVCRERNRVPELVRRDPLPAFSNN